MRTDKIEEARIAHKAHWLLGDGKVLRKEAHKMLSEGQSCLDLASRYRANATDFYAKAKEEWRKARMLSEKGKHLISEGNRTFAKGYRLCSEGNRLLKQPRRTP